jgi:protoporphyrinogen/coproporphyrinogen III oxidase
MTDGSMPQHRPESEHMRSKRVAVIGAGITGLAAAQHLITLDPQCHVTVFEASPRSGGIIHTEARDGWLLELGPDSFITNKPGGIQLCQEIGFADQLIPTDNTFRRSLVLRKGKPLPVPEGFMLMAPANPMAIATSRVLSPGGKLRLLWEMFTAGQPDVDDESLAHFVRRRFGSEALDRLVQPLVGGIYTSDPEKLSLRATLPRFLEMERDYGSVIRATLAQNKQASRSERRTSGSGARYGLFATPANGLSSFVDAVVETLRQSQRVTLKLSTPLESVTTTESQNAAGSHSRLWTVQLKDGTRETFDAVICSLPTHRAATLLHDAQFSELTTCLQQIPYASSAIVVTGHRLQDFQHPLDAFGLVIPHTEGRRILAVSFTSRKFPGRAPEGHVLLRTFVGGAMQPELLENSDSELVTLVHEELRDILGMRLPPAFSQVVRYNNAMPQYHVGHVTLVDRIQELTSQHTGLYLAGNAYRGVGIPDSISSGREAAVAAAALPLCDLK